MVDKNLFLHDLAVVAVLKNEGAYLKEWLDYYLLAGVDHFYLYDNDSTDNQAAVAAPYVEAGLVDYFPSPGKAKYYAFFNDAVKRFKFHCRYMAFVDGDEFIFPLTRQSIIELVDEILSQDKSAAGLAINWHVFGSNGQKKADVSRGVLERFTRRAPNDWERNNYVKTIADPRKLTFFDDPHSMNYFLGFYSVNEDLKLLQYAISPYVASKKIVVNHYYDKSLEEYMNIKKQRGWANSIDSLYNMELFGLCDRNEVFDDGILKYRAARAENFSLETGDARFKRVTTALTETLLSLTSARERNWETALTCLALSSYLRKNFPADADSWRICEEASLAAILIKSSDEVSLADAQLLISELPKILCLPYPAVKEIRALVMQLIPAMIKVCLIKEMWRDCAELDYLQDILKFGG